MKGKIIVKIDGRPEVYKENVEVETYKQTDSIIMDEMAYVQTSSPYHFDEIDTYGGTMKDTEGRLWEFAFVEDDQVDAYMKEANERADRIERNSKLMAELTEEEKNDIIEVDGRRYIKKIYDANYDKHNTTQVKMKLNNKTDKDILDKLNDVPNKQAYIKSLIRADIELEDEVARSDEYDNVLEYLKDISNKNEEEADAHASNYVDDTYPDMDDIRKKKIINIAVEQFLRW